MNIIFSGFFHPIIGILTGILLSFGAENLGRLIYKNFYPSFFFLNLILGVTTITLVSYILILLNLSNEINLILSYVLILLGFHRFFTFRNFRIKKINLNFYQLTIFFILILFFMITIAPPSMSDSLAYHLGVARYIYLYNHWPSPNMWLHSNISGFGEVFNTLGLYVYTDTVGSILQYISLTSFLYYFSNEIKKKDLKILFNLLILSSPVLIFLLSGSKFLILPQLITTYVLFFLLKNKKLQDKDFILIIILLCCVSNFKLNFIIPTTLLGIYTLTKININIKNLFKASFLIIIFFGPKILFNLQYIDDFKLIYLLSNVPNEFINTIRNYRESTLIFPLNLFLFESFGHIGRILGFGIIIFIFLKNISNEILITILFIIFNSFLYYFFSMSTSRMFYEMILWSSIILLFNPSFRLPFSIMKYFLFINLIFTSVLLVIGSVNLTKGVINNNLRTETMMINSYEFNAIDWLNEKINSDKVILTDLRSISLINMRVIPSDYLQYNLDEKKLIKYKKYLNSINIDYLVIKNYSTNTIFNNLIKECEVSNVLTSPKFKSETRNPFNRNSEYDVSILKFKTYVNECIN